MQNPRLIIFLAFIPALNPCYEVPSAPMISEKAALDTVVEWRSCSDAAFRILCLASNHPSTMRPAAVLFDFPTWHSLSRAQDWFCAFYQIWEVLSHYFSKYSSGNSPLCISLWVSYDGRIGLPDTVKQRCEDVLMFLRSSLFFSR